MNWEDGVIYGYGAPPAIEKQFAGTFFDTIPGIDAIWTILGILESIIFLLIVASLVRLEFMPARRKTFRLCALSLAVFTFSILAVGENVTGETSGAAQLYLYAGGTGVLFGLVLLLPPLSRSDWISGRASRFPSGE